MTRWKITLEYDGRPYSGFQRQPDRKTIQGEIEKALYKFCQQKISIVTAGRTDAGVHAKGQIAHFDLDYTNPDGSPRTIEEFSMAKAINAHLMPQPIVVLKAEKVSNDFHARFGAKKKLYSYHIINRPYGLALDQGRAWWRKTKLDVVPMQEAAKILIGHHDFTTFRDAECQAKSPMRTLDDLCVESHDIMGGQEIIIHARGMSFLHHQVRNMVGTLTLVGEGKWSVADVKTALEAKDRTAGGPTAAADGLYLVSIDYK